MFVITGKMYEVARLLNLMCHVYGDKTPIAQGRRKKSVKVFDLKEKSDDSKKRIGV
jgi:hypothetical protein